ncbi:DMT family transporter [Aestuariibius sp. 2305UL40-4]|uniref:DMT family transporter n=1 Tax=Aestuariibius violaceus TaxID=3234132 RepID=UPI00345E9E1B
MLPEPPWGTTAPLPKLAMSSGHHPVGVTFWTALIGATAFNATLSARGGRLRPTAQYLRFFAICGLQSTIVPNVASFDAYRHQPVGIMSLCFAGIPILTMGIVTAAGLEAVTIRRILGLVMGSTAMGLIALPEASLPAGATLWIALPILAATAYAGENVFIARCKPEAMGPFQVMEGLSLTAVVMLLPVRLALVAGLHVPRPGAPELAILGTGVLHVGAISAMCGCVRADLRHGQATVARHNEGSRSTETGAEAPYHSASVVVPPDALIWSAWLGRISRFDNVLSRFRNAEVSRSNPTGTPCRVRIAIHTNRHVHRQVMLTQKNSWLRPAHHRVAAKPSERSLNVCLNRELRMVASPLPRSGMRVAV